MFYSGLDFIKIDILTKVHDWIVWSVHMVFLRMDLMT